MHAGVVIIDEFNRLLGSDMSLAFQIAKVKNRLFCAILY
jgi:hypothetical protein